MKPIKKGIALLLTMAVFLTFAGFPAQALSLDASSALSEGRYPETDGDDAWEEEEAEAYQLWLATVPFTGFGKVQEGLRVVALRAESDGKNGRILRILVPGTLLEVSAQFLNDLDGEIWCAVYALDAYGYVMRSQIVPLEGGEARERGVPAPDIAELEE